VLGPHEVPARLRDLPLLREVADRTEVTANFSVPTLDENAWRASEPRTPHPRARLEAVAELNAAGIPTGILVAPLMPGINDDPRQVDRILTIAAEAGARSVGGIALHLRGEVRGIFFEWLRSYRPDLLDHYEALYRRGAYAPPEERRRLSDLLRRPTASGRRPPWRPPPDMRRPGDPAARDPAPEREPGPPPERQRSHGTAARAGSRPAGPGTAAGGRPTAPGGADTRQEVLF
jgi:hypothetical protein